MSLGTLPRLLVLLLAFVATLEARPRPVSPPRLAGAPDGIAFHDSAGNGDRILTLWSDARNKRVTAFSIVDSDLSLVSKGTLPFGGLYAAHAAKLPGGGFSIVQPCAAGAPAWLCIVRLSADGAVERTSKIDAPDVTWATIATSAEGLSLVVWNERENDTMMVKGALLDSSLALLTRMQIGSSPSDGGPTPRVVADHDRFTVAWKDTRRILTADVDFSGAASSSTVLGEIPEFWGTSAVDIATNGAETLVTWSHPRHNGGPSEIVTRVRKDALWSLARSMPARQPLRVSAASGADGFLVAFAAGFEMAPDALAAFVEPSGRLAAIRVSTGISGTRHLDVVGTDRGFVFVHQAVRIEPYFDIDDSVLLGRSADRRGKLLPGDVLLTTSLAAQQQHAAAWGPGEGLVAWSERVGANEWGIRAVRLDTEGSRIGEDDLVMPFAGRDQVLPAVAYGGSSYLLLWTEVAPDGWTGALRGVHVGIDGRIVEPEPITIATDLDPRSRAAAAWNGEGWLVAWADATSQRIAGAEIADEGVRGLGFLSPELDASRERDADPALLWTGERYFLAWAGFAILPGCQFTCPPLASGFARSLERDLTGGIPLPLGLGGKPRIAWSAADVAVALTGPALVRVDREATQADRIEMDWNNDGEVDVNWSGSAWDVVWTDVWRGATGNLYRATVRDFASKPRITAIAETAAGEANPVLLRAPDPVVLYELRSPEHDWIPVVVAENLHELEQRVVSPLLIGYRSAPDTVTLRWTDPYPDGTPTLLTRLPGEPLLSVPGVLPGATSAVVPLAAHQTASFILCAVRDEGGSFCSDEVVVGPYEPRRRGVGR